ncbi:formate dehydrogenase accessory sulfurtransferase FdhD [Achromobacter sp. Marseille-Q4962]|uniref:formate dehydrogenase accessory sulfurtransferase FdhD n=1 Tax=Achromobacter sp. Marseille-Q4962 TaxID=2942202 RepID=UPI0020734368|nr:formate dehydrogenase accessory sulfurtransferase FdhD [Achromobacter sp. Marseille-Q4962]
MSTPDSLPADHVRLPVIRLREGAAEGGRAEDAVAEETPVALEYNGISHATMLATPADLEDFALGFSLSEGIIDRPGDVRGIDVAPQCGGVVVQVEISSACEMRLKARRRAMAGRTGCGLCGVETLPEVLRPVAPVPEAPPIPVSAVLRAMRDLRASQRLHALTGATHAAAWAAPDGRLALLREDVGRHNALDKLVGALARQGRAAADGMVLVSSRASFEMVQKTAAAGAGVLAAVSAPTALAVRLAGTAGIALLGFARGDSATLYTHPERLVA